MSAVSPGLDVLGAVACVLLPTAVVALLWCVAREPVLRSAHACHGALLEARLRYLQLPVSGTRVVGLQLRCLLLLGASAVVLGSPWPLPVAAAVAVVPTAWLERRCTERSRRIAGQIDGGLLAIANALRASSSLGESLASAAQVVPSPLRDELGLVLREHALGVPVDRALTHMAERVGSPVVKAALVTVRVARNTGGDLVETLHTAAASLREMARLEGVVRTKTAEGRAQGAVIAVVPAPLLYGLDALDPELLAPIWETAAGHVVLAIGAVLWICALLLARRIVDVDI